MLTARSFWTIDSNLKPFVRDGDYLQGCQRFETDDVMPEDSEEDKIEKLRQRAFRVDASLNRDHFFWANAIEQDIEERRLRRHMGDVKVRPSKESSTTKRRRQEEASAVQSKRSRSNGNTSTYKRHDEEEEEMDSENELFVTKEEEKRSHGRAHKGTSKQDVDAEQAKYQANHKTSWERKRGYVNRSSVASSLH